MTLKILWDMSEWKEIPLSKTTKFIVDNRGKTAPTELSGIPLIATNCINNNNLFPVYENLRYVSKTTYDTWFRSHPEPGDIILTLKGSQNGAVCLVPDPVDFVIAQDMVALRVDEDVIDRLFLFAALRSSEIQIQIKNLDVSGVIPHLKKSDFDKLIIPLPDRKVQENIGQIYFSMSNKIDLLHRQNATLEKMAETLFRQWFVEEAKEEWEEKTLGELLTITSSKRIFYSEYVDAGVPFYRSKEIIELRKNGSTQSELYIPNERFEEINSKFGSPKEGDILMTSVGTLGVAYRVKAKDKFYFKDGNLTWFKDFKGLPSSIVYLWLISKIGQEELASITIGSTQQALTIEGLKSISFKIPPKVVLIQTERVFNNIISKIDSNQTQIRTLTAMLLPKLMSGEVSVSNFGEVKVEMN
jgi:type I restriction enzyme, S subunit